MASQSTSSVRDILQTMDYGPAPESDAAVLEWLRRHRDGFGHFIGGAFQPSTGGERFRVFNPARGTRLATVAEGMPGDVDAAVSAARAAFPGWAVLSGHDRAKRLHAIARAIQRHEGFLAVVETLDTGKPVRECRDIDVPLAARHFLHHAGWAEVMETEFPGARPLGVCGQIVPWSSPLLMLAWKIAPAIAAGNTVVLKPAEFTPLTALAFGEICREAGLPAGVVNIVTGDGATGATLAAHAGVDKIAFTGSTDVGRLVRRATAGSGKALTLELGGKSPFIVYEDADLDAAVEGIVDAVWLNAGQTGACGRLLLQEGIAPRFLAKLERRMETLRVGDPLDRAIDVGAIVAPVQLQRIRDLVMRGLEDGARLVQASGPIPDVGCFYPPTVLADVEASSIVAETEIFGPVAVAMTFRTPDEAVQMANHTRTGLAATIFTEDAGLALETATRLQAGVVWINATNLFDPAAPFGGTRESGFGREGGREGFSAYLATVRLDGEADLVAAPAPLDVAPGLPLGSDPVPTIDRTAKLSIGGRQVRPEAGASYTVISAAGAPVGRAGFGSRKDIRNAVEAARAASDWTRMAPCSRAEGLYRLAENLGTRAVEFERRLVSFGAEGWVAALEVETAIRRTFFYAAQSERQDGRVPATQGGHLTLALNEPFGVMGLVCPDEAPLLGFLSLILPALALGNRVVAVPSQAHPLAATDLAQVLDASDIPAGTVNIVTGPRRDLARTLAEHDGVAALWHFGDRESILEAELASTGNLKPIWSKNGRGVDWYSADEGQGRPFLDAARQTKTVWMPYIGS